MKNFTKNIIFLLAIFVASFGISITVQAGTDVHIFNTSNLKQIGSFSAYGSSFANGVKVAIGNVTGDANPEIVTITGEGSRSFVRVFDKNGNPLAWSVYPFHPQYLGGGSVALGDVDGDYLDEIVVSPSGAGGPLVRVYDYGRAKPQASFYAFVENYRGGVNVASADINKDGKAEIITSTASDRGHVVVYTGQGNFTGLSYFPFGQNFREGLSVSAGDITGNGKAEIITGSQGNTTSRVKIYKADASKHILGNFLAYGEALIGVNTTIQDVDGDNVGEIITAPAQGGTSHVRAFEASGQNMASFNFFVFDENMRSGYSLSAYGGRLAVVPATFTSQSDVCKNKKCVALTFDDGGSTNGSFEKILDTLKKHNAKATFFMVGRWMDSHRSMVKRVYDEGHRLGNHTWNHSVATRISSGQLRSELQKVDDLVMQITGESVKPHFRYPGGSHNGYTDKVVRDAGYYYWQWTADPRDSMGNNSPASIKNLALNGLHDGSVILFHTGSFASASALDSIIVEIKRQGYELVTLDSIAWEASNQW